MISKSLIKKWTNMVRGKSVFHVTQNEGKYYSLDEVKGYYNDLTEKVPATTNLDISGVPINIISNGSMTKQVYFPITVFQFGLGAYDLYLENNEEDNIRKAIACADWAVSHQNEDGSWNAFGMLNYSNPYSAMAQGEGASLLLRAYKHTSKEEYLDRARKALEFMLLPRLEGGTTEYQIDGIVLYEYPEKPLVLNGWIFASFGLLDMYLTTKEKKWLNLYRRSISAMENMIPRFNTGSWSFYDISGKYTSPFYHHLHIELLKTVAKTYPSRVTLEVFIALWENYEKSFFKSKKAFFLKAVQKLNEKKSEEWVLVG